MFEYKMLPCHSENENNIYYKGDTNVLQNNKRCRKCEYIKSLCYFIFKEFKDYALEKCCDVDHPDTNQPEAILVNKNNHLDKIVIEVKTLHDLFDNNRDKDKVEREKSYHFQKVLDKIGDKVFKNLDSKLEEMNFTLTPELTKLFLYGLLLTIYVDSEYKDINGIKYAESKSTYKEFLKYKNKNEEKLINAIAENVVDYIVYNIISCIKSYKFIPCYEFKIDKFNFAIGKTDREGWLSIQYSEGRVGISFLDLPVDAVESCLNEYFQECEKKFINYMSDDYKRALLIVNENRYSKDKLLEIIKEYGTPKFIDDVWCAFYVYEDIWNERLEDFDGETIVDVDYCKVHDKIQIT